MTSPVTIVDYDHQWPIMYEMEKAAILHVVGGMLVEIQHIGSTALPGLRAKPIIDIMAAVRKLADVEQCIKPLESISYEYLAEYGIPGRHYFRKPPGTTRSTHHLHIVEQASDLWERHVLFRDYLLAHPEIAREYQELKKTLIATFHSNRDAYTEGKTSFIESNIEKARLWKTMRHKASNEERPA